MQLTTTTIAAMEPKKFLTPADIESVVVDEAYLVFPGTTVTVCLLTLKNGAKTIGFNYGAIDPERQNWEQGKVEARKQAIEKVWELEGYLVRHQLALHGMVKSFYDKAIETGALIPISSTSSDQEHE